MPAGTSGGPVKAWRAVSLYTDAANMREYASGFLQPNSRDWEYYVEEMILTVQISLWATVLGLVGADGIGQVLFETIRGFYYAEIAAFIIAVVITVSLIDILSQPLIARSTVT